MMDNFIEIYKGAFNAEYCDKVIDAFKIAEQNGLTMNRQDHDQAPKTDKEDLATFIPSFPMIHTDKNILDEFNRVFWGECYKQYAAKYSILDTFSPHNSFTIKLQKTQPGQGYHIWHAETTGKESSTRLLTWTAYMNDEFEAGETEFLYQQYRYKPSKGDVIIFPAAFTHTHRGNPPIGADKYIITGWVEF
jgi:hypothetical protein